MTSFSGSRTRMMVGASTLAASSAGAMVAGMIRQKMTIVEFGPATLAVIGQAALFQGIWLTVVGVAIVNGARVTVSNGNYPLAEREATATWLTRAPVLAGVTLFPVAIWLGPLVSDFYTGTREWGALFAMSAIGGFVQVGLQNAFSTCQIFAGAREFVGAAATSTVASIVAMTALLVTGGLITLFASFIIVPAVGWGSIVASSATYRGILLQKAQLHWSYLRPVLKVAFATSITGGMALAVPSIISSQVAKSSSLSQAAFIQPLLLVPSIAGLVIASWTSVTMYHYNQTESEGTAVRRQGPWRDAIAVGAVLSFLAVLALPLVPVAVELLFDSSLVAATPLVAVQVGAEILTGIVWVASSMLLPAGRFWVFICLGAVGLTVKLVLSLTLLGTVGPISLAWGALAQNLVMIALMVALLRPTLGWRHWCALATTVLAAIATCLAWLEFPAFQLTPWIVAGSLATLTVMLTAGPGHSRMGFRVSQ